MLIVNVLPPLVCSPDGDRIEFFQSMWDQLAHERVKNDYLKRKIERLEKV
jgi:hypothetical protein